MEIINFLKESHDLKEFKKLLKTEDLDYQTILGTTALIYTVNKKFYKQFDLLVKAGANLNLQTNNGNTALIRAMVKKQDRMVKVLLANKADANIRNNKGLDVFDFLDDDAEADRLRKIHSGKLGRFARLAR